MRIFFLSFPLLYVAISCHGATVYTYGNSNMYGAGGTRTTTDTVLTIESRGGWLARDDVNSVDIGSEVVRLADSSFINLYHLYSITIPSTVTSISSYAFNGSIQLRSIYFLGNAPSIDSDNYLGNAPATIYVLPTATGWGSSFGQKGVVVLPEPSSLSLLTLGGVVVALRRKQR